MITFVKKSDLPLPVPGETEENRFERIRKIAATRHRASDTNGTRRRARQTVEEFEPRPTPGVATRNARRTVTTDH